MYKNAPKLVLTPKNQHLPQNNTKIALNNCQTSIKKTIYKMSNQCDCNNKTTNHKLEKNK